MNGRFRISAIDNGPWLLVREWAAGVADRLSVRRGSAAYAGAPLVSCCLFIGYPRSGHSVVGSVLDAHPDAMVSHRLDAVAYIERGFSPAMLAHMIVRNSRRFARGGRRLTGYAYRIDGAWQGSYRELRVIGDQEGRLTTERLGAQPDILDSFERRFAVPVRLIHVIRNPYDNIATWATRRFAALEPTIDAYFDLCHAVARVAACREGRGILQVRYEEFVRRPFQATAELWRFAGLSPDEDVQSRCAAVVRGPHRSRYERTWTNRLIDDVAVRMRELPFLNGYTWES